MCPNGRIRDCREISPLVLSTLLGLTRCLRPISYVGTGSRRDYPWETKIKHEGVRFDQFKAMISVPCEAFYN